MPTGPPLKIIWGSQTGTAEDFAEQLRAKARQLKFNAESIDIEEYDRDSLADEEAPVVFLLATYGEGEPTDNAKEFYEWLMDSSLDADLSSLKYTVFGLGNTTYEHYNAVGRAVDKRLEELGAKKIYPRGEGDDDSSLEEDFMAWTTDLWPTLCRLSGLDYSVVEADVDPVPRARLEISTENAVEKEHSLGTRVGVGFDLKKPFIANIVVNRELHGVGSDRSCRHIEFEVGNKLPYQTGDHLGVYPRNSSVLVELLAKRLGAEASLDKVITLYPIGQSAAKPIFGPVSLRTALTQHLDITTPPRKAILRALAQYASDPTEKAYLMTISSLKEDSLPPARQYNTWIKANRRTIGEVLDALPSVQPPLGHLLELLPSLAPRYYSISSSPLLHPTRIHITCVLSRFHTGTGRLHDGVASTRLLSLIPTEGDGGSPPSAPIFVRRSQFRPPSRPETPLIMVGPGTGIAPFRAFLQHRPLAAKGAPLGDSMLFFGCRSRDIDYLYKEELEAAKEANHLTDLVVAFSREQAEKVYVQHRILELKDRVWDMLHNKNAHLYICGDAAHMAVDVRAALENVFQQCGNLSPEAASAYYAALQDKGRLATDVWF